MVNFHYIFSPLHIQTLTNQNVYFDRAVGHGYYYHRSLRAELSLKDTQQEKTDWAKFVRISMIIVSVGWEQMSIVVRT